jgi:flagellar protein FlaH
MPVVTTGISGLDAQLGGGVPAGTTLVLLAEPGNGISIFSEQFTGGGLSAGESVFYFLLDRPAQNVRTGVTEFVRQSSGATGGKLSIFDGYSTQFGRSVGAAGDLVGVARDQALATALKQVQSAGYDGPYRLTFESLSAVTGPQNEREVVEFMRTLVFLGQETGGVHLVSVVKGLHSPWFETQLRHLAGGVLELGIERKGFGIYPYLVVSKLMGVRDAARILLYKETDKGLWLESTKRVF